MVKRHIICNNFFFQSDIQFGMEGAGVTYVF